MKWVQNKCGKARNNCKIAAEDQFIYTPPRKERPGMRKIPGHTYFEREVSATVFVIYTPHQEEVDQLLPESDPYKHLAAALFKTYFDKDGNVRMDTDMCQSPNTAPKHQKKRKEDTGCGDLTQADERHQKYRSEKSNQQTETQKI